MFTVQVPATIANLGPGFDSFGMAVCLYNRFSFQVAERDALIISTDSSVDTTTLQQESQQAAGTGLLFKAMNHRISHNFWRNAPAGRFFRGFSDLG